MLIGMRGIAFVFETRINVIKILKILQPDEIPEIW